MKKLFYFGCIEDKGHFLFCEDGRHANGSNARFPGVNEALLSHIDGIFTPDNRRQGFYLESIVPPCRIVAWWDYTVDGRPGSNSNLIGIGYDSAEEMLDEACKQYPSVMNRQERPKPIELPVIKTS